MASAGKITIETTPQIEEAIEHLMPIADAARAMVDCAERRGGVAFCPDEYDRVAQAVERRQQWIRETRAIKAVK
jgi:hypothetical protein